MFLVTAGGEVVGRVVGERESEERGEREWRG